MRRTARIVLGAAVASAVAQVASAQTLFNEDFNDGAASGRWTTRSNSDSGTNDFLVNLAFDYSSLSIPAAPGGAGTTGALMDANRTAEGPLEAEGVNIFPNAQNFSGDYTFRVDLWGQVVGAAGTTEDSVYGLNASGTRTNWYSFLGPGTDGLFYSVTGDGGTGSDNDFIGYTGNPTSDPLALALYDNLDPLPQQVFPADPLDPLDLGGAPSNRWTTVEVSSINGRVMFRLNGEVFDIFDNAAFSSGNVFLGHQDLFNSINTDTFSIYDNARVLRAHTWANDADSGWDTASNWSSGTVPSGEGAMAFFGNNTTAARTVAFGAAKTVGDVIFDSGNSFTVSGSNLLTLNGVQQQTSLVVIRGTHAINTPITALRDVLISTRDDSVVGPALTLGGDLNFAGATVTKTGPAGLAVKNLRGGGVKVAGGEVEISPDGTSAGASKVSNLSIRGDATPTATVDITNNLLVVDYSGATPYDTIKAQIISGRAGGLYNGLGINSSTAAATAGREIGYAEASSIGGAGSLLGQSYDASTVLIRYVLPGDVNLSGTVNIGDFAVLAANFNTPGDWQNGDFNYDGNVGIGDFSLLAANFNSSISSDLPRGAAVPEPALAAMVPLVGLLVRRRR